MDPRYTRQENSPRNPPYKTIGAIAVALFSVVTLFLGVFKIDETERGVITKWGKFSHIAQPGLNFRWPYVDGLTRMDVRESNPKFVDMEMYSADNQLAKVDVSVVLRPKTDNDSLRVIYTRYGSVENAIKVIFGPIVPAETKVVFGKYNAQRAIQERDKLNSDAKNEIIDAVGTSPLFDIYRVPVEDIEFSKAYIQSIEENMKAEVEVRKTRNNWEREKVSADILRTKADAEAYKVEAQGKAEALAIDLVGKALAQNPKYIDKLQAERWSGNHPNQLTIMSGGAVSHPVPFYDVTPKK